MNILRNIEVIINHTSPYYNGKRGTLINESVHPDYYVVRIHSTKERKLFTLSQLTKLDGTSLAT